MSSKRAIGDVRPSQVITTFGPGAIVDLQTLSVIVSGIDTWSPQEELVIREPRLERALRVNRFFQAEPVSGGFGYRKGTVPVSVFPRYQVCSNPNCATLSEYRGLKYGYPSLEDRTGKLIKEYGGDPNVNHLCRYNDITQEIECKAPNCSGRGKGKRAPTVPAPFVVACPSGHIDDFPWRAYVHRDADDSCRQRMQLVYSGTTGSVSDIWVYCACGKKRSVSDAFGENRSLALGECLRKRPWLGINNIDPDECKHAGQVRAIQRGATNGWFPLVRSALSIKEAASPIGQALKKCPQYQVEKIDSPEKLQTLLDMNMFPALAEFKAEDIWRTIEKARGNIENDEIDLRLPEWNAFRDIAGSNQGEQSDFFLEAGEVPDFLADKVERIVLARKLLEVRALTSFTRIDYASGMDDDGMGASRAPIYKEQQDWLPAIEVRGEGIFLELKEEALIAWEAEPGVQKRAAAIEQKYKEWAAERGVDSDDFPGARYVLLHSLAHVLMRQLALDCGYSESSVRERIYSSTDPERKMAGILLYTASADSEGSLGGLVDLGTKERFPNLIHNALENAKRCSSDPLCADHQPDVHATINGAACHACVLAPETSCEAFNRFLDRNFLVPTMAYSDMAYFK
ncbi:DrmB family protein [Aeromonas veronii]|uniref:DrmB family protein n=1 Tax=Aeromonas veronii TaxID=654 RepID=UPI003981A5BD